MALCLATESYSEGFSYSPHACFFSVLINLIVIYVCYSCETKYSEFIVSHVADIFYVYVYGLHIVIFFFLRFLDHTQRRTTVGRTPLDE